MVATVNRLTPQSLPNGVDVVFTTPSLTATDVVVIITTVRATTIPTISGLGTLQDAITISNPNSRGIQVKYQTGLVGVKTITIRNTESFNTGRANILILSNLNQQILDGFTRTNFDSVHLASQTPTVQDFSNGCVGIAVAICTNSATLSFPTNTEPVAGWVSDDTFTGSNPPLFVHHVVGVSPGTFKATISNTSPNYEDAIMLVFGQAIIPVPFRGWGMAI